jgi:hypothetical protein
VTAETTELVGELDALLDQLRAEVAESEQLQAEIRRRSA